MNPLYLLIPVFLPVLLGGASFILPFRSIKARNIYVLTGLTVCSVFVWALALSTPENSLVLLNFTDALSISLRLDGAGKIFACLSATLWPLTAIYAFEYMKHEEHLKMFYAFFVTAFGATMGIAMAENMLTMYLFYEFLTISTIPLVMQGMAHKHKAAARKYMIYSIGGAAFAFPAVVFLIINGADTFAYGGNSALLDNSGISFVLFVAGFIGFGVKAAMFPLHGWLPTASVAPTPVTALLHAVAVVKAGAFAVIRLIYYSYGADYLRGTWAQNAVMTICIITVLYGSVNALRQRHFKRRLAYSTVSNLSYITFAATIMTPAGLVAAFCHMLFHSVIKIGAFFSAGAVLHTTNKEYIHQLEGLGRKMPVTFACYTVYALALTGIPPLCGFFSKWYIATAGIDADNALAVAGVVILLISAFLTAMYMLSPAIKAFFTDKEKPAEIKEAGVCMLIPMILCAVLCILLGVFARVPVAAITEVLGI